MRRNANLEHYAEVMHYEEQLRQMPALTSGGVAPRPLATCIGGLLALEAMRLLTGVVVPQTVGRILRLDFFAPDMTYHRILRFPNCPACGYGKRPAVSFP
jgi:hypothetical protein